MADATLNMLAAAMKARWNCEQAHQQLKEELGLDLFARPPTRQCPHCEKPLTDPVDPNLPNWR